MKIIKRIFGSKKEDINKSSTEEKSQKSVEDEMGLTIKNSDLTKINGEIVELGLDYFLEEGILRDIPVVGAINGVYNLSKNIRTAYFIKKIVRFLFQLNDTTIYERTEFINSIESKEGYTKVGEALILIIERMDDFQKADILGKLLKASIQGKFDYNTFLYLSHLINNNHTRHLFTLSKTLENGKYFIHKLSELELESLIRGGIMENYNEAKEYKEKMQQGGEVVIENRVNTIHKQAFETKISKSGHAILKYGFNYF